MAAGAGGYLPAGAATSIPRVIHVGATREIKTTMEASQQARDGDVIEIDAGDYIADTASWVQDRLTIRGVGGPVRLIAAGANAEGKGIWVVKGGHVTIENIAFSGARVADHNGAGIRFEKGHLIVRNCVFTDSENGLLTAGGDGELEIEGSEFFGNGGGDGHTHNLYVGAIKKLTVKGSYFHHANVGHLLKSRAAENFIINNRLTDETGGRASYELEFPNGGIAYVIGNIIEQSAMTDNATIISVGSEGYTWPRNELYLSSNTIADDRPQNGLFLNILPGLGVLKGFNNVLIGNARSVTGTAEEFGASRFPGWREVAKSARDTVKTFIRPEATNKPVPKLVAQFSNNVNVEWDQLAMPTRYDYRIRPQSSLMGKFVQPGFANGVNLLPDAEYVHPRSVRGLKSPLKFPGAVQTVAK